MPANQNYFSVLLSCMLVLVSTCVQSQILDPTFGWGGYVSYPFDNAKEVPYRVTVGPNGKIYASGTRLPQYIDENPAWWVACFNPDGSRDLTFGTGGITYWNVCTGSEYTMGIDADTTGNVFILGYEEYSAVNAEDRGLIGKVRPNGTPDPGYGLYPSQPGLAFISDPGNKVHAMAMVKLPDGSRNAAFNTQDTYFNGSDAEVIIVKIDTSGLVDSTFLAPASYSTPFGPNGVAVAAVATPEGGFYIYGAVASTSYIAKIGPDGALDTSYGNNGLCTLPSITGPGYDYDQSLFLDHAGRLIFKKGAGGIARILPQGVLDTGFGQSGVVLGPVSATVVDTLGRVYTVMNDSLYRYSVSGALDPSFGTNGAFPLVRPVDHFGEMTLSPDGGRLIILQDCTCSDNPPYSGQIAGGTVHLTCVDLTGGGVTTSIGSAGTSTMKVYPNPATDHVRITTDRPENRLEVLDACGRAIMVREHIVSRDLTLDVSKLSPGTYLIRQFDQQGAVSNSRLSIVR